MLNGCQPMVSRHEIGTPNDRSKGTGRLVSIDKALVMDLLRGCKTSIFAKVRLKLYSLGSVCLSVSSQQPVAETDHGDES